MRCLLPLIHAAVLAACGGGESVPPASRAEAVAGYAQCTPAPRPTAALAGLQRQGYPLQTVDRLAVRALLAQRAFAELDRLLSAYADSAWRDFRLEYRLLDAFGALDVADPALTPLLDDFVAAVAGSSSPYLARATHRVELGWQARGGAYAYGTTDQQFRRMGAHFADAARDIVAADSIAPCHFMSYLLRLRIVLASGAADASEAVVTQGLEVHPYSFLLRRRHMYGLSPRWGGSYEAMDAFGASVDSLVAVNPKLQALKGYSAWDRGRVAWARGDTMEALTELNDALIRLFYQGFALERGRLYHRIGQYADALSDLTYVLEERPYDVDALYYRARSHYAIGRVSRGETRAQHHRAAFRDIELAALLDPTDEYVQRSRAFYLEHIPQFAPRAAGQ